MKSGVDIIAMMDNAVPQLCAVCGKQMEYHPEKGYYGDFAHLLNNTKSHRSYYGSALISSKHNGLPVCSDNQNKCNNSIGVNRSSQPVLADRIAVKIAAMDANDRMGENNE